MARNAHRIGRGTVLEGYIPGVLCTPTNYVTPAIARMQMGGASRLIREAGSRSRIASWRLPHMSAERRAERARRPIPDPARQPPRSCSTVHDRAGSPCMWRIATTIRGSANPRSSPGGVFSPGVARSASISSTSTRRARAHAPAGRAGLRAGHELRGQTAASACPGSSPIRSTVRVEDLRFVRESGRRDDRGRRGGSRVACGERPVEAVELRSGAGCGGARSAPARSRYRYTSRRCPTLTTSTMCLVSWTAQTNR